MAIRIAPSLLSADFGCFRSALQAVEAEVDIIHFDVMDGHFVPNLTFGPALIAALRPSTELIFDVHLMIERPEASLERYIEAGADRIAVHVEATPHVHRAVTAIKRAGKLAGAAVNPGTPVEAVFPLLGDIDYVLVMTVNPGFGGQALIPSTLKKVRALRERLSAEGRTLPIMVDGGIDRTTIRAAKASGADEFVAGSAVFGAEDPVHAIRALRAAAGGVQGNP